MDFQKALDKILNELNTNFLEGILSSEAIALEPGSLPYIIFTACFMWELFKICKTIVDTGHIDMKRAVNFVIAISFTLMCYGKINHRNIAGLDFAGSLPTEYRAKVKNPDLLIDTHSYLRYLFAGTIRQAINETPNSKRSEMKEFIDKQAMISYFCEERPNKEACQKEWGEKSLKEVEAEFDKDPDCGMTEVGCYMKHYINRPIEITFTANNLINAINWILDLIRSALIILVFIGYFLTLVVTFFMLKLILPFIIIAETRSSVIEGIRFFMSTSAYTFMIALFKFITAWLVESVFQTIVFAQSSGLAYGLTVFIGVLLIFCSLVAEVGMLFMIPRFSSALFDLNLSVFVKISESIQQTVGTVTGFATGVAATGGMMAAGTAAKAGIGKGSTSNFGSGSGANRFSSGSGADGFSGPNNSKLSSPTQAPSSYSSSPGMDGLREASKPRDNSPSPESSVNKDFFKADSKMNLSPDKSDSKTKSDSSLGDPLENKSMKKPEPQAQKKQVQSPPSALSASKKKELMASVKNQAKDKAKKAGSMALGTTKFAAKATGVLAKQAIGIGLSSMANGGGTGLLSDLTQRTSRAKQGAQNFKAQAEKDRDQKFFDTTGLSTDGAIGEVYQSENLKSFTDLRGQEDFFKERMSETINREAEIHDEISELETQYQNDLGNTELAKNLSAKRDELKSIVEEKESQREHFEKLKEEISLTEEKLKIEAKKLSSSKLPQSIVNGMTNPEIDVEENPLFKFMDNKEELQKRIAQVQSNYNRADSILSKEMSKFGKISAPTYKKVVKIMQNIPNQKALELFSKYGIK